MYSIDYDLLEKNVLRYYSGEYMPQHSGQTFTVAQLALNFVETGTNVFVVVPTRTHFECMKQYLSMWLYHYSDQDLASGEEPLLERINFMSFNNDKPYLNVVVADCPDLWCVTRGYSECVVLTDSFVPENL